MSNTGPGADKSTTSNTRPGKGKECGRESKYCPPATLSEEGAVCPAGFWCAGGANDKTACAGGTYAATDGSASVAACSGRCSRPRSPCRRSCGGYAGRCFAVLAPLPLPVMLADARAPAVLAAAPLAVMLADARARAYIHMPHAPRSPPPPQRASLLFQ